MIDEKLRKQLDSHFEPEVLKKIKTICNGFHEDDEVNFFIGDYYWKQLSDFWKFEWVKSGDNGTVTPRRRDKFVYRGITIHRDTENYHRFDIEE